MNDSALALPIPDSYLEEIEHKVTSLRKNLKEVKNCKDRLTNQTKELKEFTKSIFEISCEWEEMGNQSAGPSE